MASRCRRCDGRIPSPNYGPDPEHRIEDCIASLGARMEKIRHMLEDESETLDRKTLLSALDVRVW